MLKKSISEKLRRFYKLVVILFQIKLVFEEFLGGEKITDTEPYKNDKVEGKRYNHIVGNYI